MDSAERNLKELNTMFKPTHLKLFSFELMIEPTNYSGLSYIRDSATERELQIGKVRVVISG